MNAHLKPAYDVERLRADFPILSERPYGKPLVYLDNAASRAEAARGASNG